MKNIFVGEQKQLLSILSSMQPICTKRTTLDVTSLILFQVSHREMICKATDLEISLQTSYQLKSSDITEIRTFLVSGRRIFDLVKELEGDITFILDDTSLRVQSQSVNLLLNIHDADTFPSFPERIENLMQFDAHFLLEILNKVAFLVPQSNSNKALNGLLLEISPTELKMTASDGHCLAQITTTVYTLDTPLQWLLPRRAVFEIKKILEHSNSTHIFFGVCDNQLVFSGESFNFFTKIMVNSFPKYAAILGKDDFIPASVDRAHFIKALRRSACMLSGQFIATHFTFHNNAVKISMHNKDVGTLEEEVTLADLITNTCDVSFYAPYLLNGLQVFPNENIRFFLHSRTRPIIFDDSGVSNNTAYHMLYLVMPVARNDGQ